jgi:hypothetical protein
MPAKRVDDREKRQRSRGGAALAVRVAERQLHLLVVEIALNAKPFLTQASRGQRRREKPERLRGRAGGLR